MAIINTTNQGFMSRREGAKVISRKRQIEQDKAGYKIHVTEKGYWINAWHSGT